MVKQQSRGLTFELCDLLTLHDHNSHFHSKRCFLFSRGFLTVGFLTWLCRLLHEGDLAAEELARRWPCATFQRCFCVTPEWSMAWASHMFKANKRWLGERKLSVMYLDHNLQFIPFVLHSSMLFVCFIFWDSSRDVALAFNVIANWIFKREEVIMTH